MSCFYELVHNSYSICSTTPNNKNEMALLNILVYLFTYVDLNNDMWSTIIQRHFFLYIMNYVTN